MLLAWSRRDVYALGFGPFPIILSTNLFLWFKPECFYLQFLLVSVGLQIETLGLEPEEQVGAEDDGKQPKPRAYTSRRDQASSMSKAYANSNCATMRCAD